MLAVGISKESSSPWVVHMIFAHTKSRDLCPLSGANKRTVKDAYHLPRPDEAQHYLVGSAVFLSLDLQNGHRKLQIHEEDRPKTAFSPGPSSAECPLVYQVYHLMDTVCCGLTFVTTYLDDVLVHHWKRFCEVFQLSFLI